MDSRQRQLFILVSVLVLMAVAMLFMFVYAPDTAEPFSFELVLPGFFGSILEAIVNSFEGFIDLLLTGLSLF